MPAAIHLAKAYAQCLYQTAVQQSILEKVYKSAYLLVALCNTHPNLVAFLRNPVVKPHQKQQTLQRILHPYIDKHTLVFLLFVIKKRRANHLLAIMQAFVTHYKRKAKIQIAHLTTAVKADPKVKDQLTSLAARLTPCHTIELIEHLDPTIIGGYILQIENKQVDASLRTKLRQLKHWWTTKPTAKAIPPIT